MPRKKPRGPSQDDKKSQLREKTLKAMKKQKRKPFWKRYEDPISYLIIAIFLGLVIYSKFSSPGPNLKKILVNEEEYIQSVNDDPQYKFKARPNPYFEGNTLQDYRNMLNNKIGTKNEMDKCAVQDSLQQITLPQNFEFSKNYPRC